MVGADHEVPIAARRGLDQSRSRGCRAAQRFRADLFYRINVVAIPVPPLRKRISDVLILAHHFVRKDRQTHFQTGRRHTPGAAQRLLEGDGAIVRRQSRTVSSARSPSVGSTRSSLTIRPRRCPSRRLDRCHAGQMLTLAAMQHRYVREVLDATAGNKAKAARVLGIDRRSLYRRLSAVQMKGVIVGAVG